MQQIVKIAMLGALGALAMSIAAVPTEAEAKGFKKLGAAVVVGKAINRANRANAKDRDESSNAADDEMTEATPVADAPVAEPPLPKLEPMIAAAAPVSGPLVCIAGCYDKLGQPIRR